MSRGPAIVVTGIGTVSPLGTGVEALAAALAAGPPPPPPEARDPSERCFLRAAGFDPKRWIPAMTLRRLDRGSALAVASARLALEDARLEVAQAPERVAVVLGTGGAGIDATARLFREMVAQGAEAASALLFPNTVPNAPAGQVAIATGACGPSATFSAKVCAAEDAIGFAADLLALGRCDAALAGGVDEVSEALLHAYRRLRALSRSGAARPFDRARDGVILGEGATLLLLEREETAERRGARARARLLGHAATTAPLPPSTDPGTAAPLARNLRAALEDAGILAGALMCVSASASGARGLDLLEAEALGAALGEALAGVPVASWKGAAGDGMAGGGLRAAMACLAIRGGHVPSTAGLREVDAAVLERAARGARASGAGPEGGAPPALDVVSEGPPRLRRPGPVLLSALGDGGGFHSLVVGPP